MNKEKNHRPSHKILEILSERTLAKKKHHFSLLLNSSWRSSRTKEKKNLTEIFTLSVKTCLLFKKHAPKSEQSE